MKNWRESLPQFVRNPNPNIYHSNNYVVVDFETTNLDNGDPVNASNKIVLACYSYKGKLYSVWGNEYQQQHLVEVCESADFIVAHNAKFELGWLKRCGLDISRVLVWDTQIGDYVLSGNRRWRLRLNDCLERRGLGVKESVVESMIHGGICPSEIPESWLERYCKRDVVLTHRLFKVQRKDLNDEELFPVMFTRCIFTPVLVDIEGRGMYLHEDRVRTICRKYNNQLRILENEFSELSGGINVKSTKQKRKFFYEDLGFAVPKWPNGKPMLTPAGDPMTGAEAIARFRPRNNKQRRVIDLIKKISKIKDAKSKTLDKFLACIEEAGGTLYASLNQTVTQTHRLSSTGKKYSVQYQNIDRNFKPLITARKPGWKIGEVDYAQLEYRVAVFLGDDDAGRWDIENNVDAHSFTASVIFEEEWKAAGSNRDSPEGSRLRTEAKRETFKPLILAA